MHQIQFRLGLRPGFAAGAYSAPQTPYLDLRGLLLMGGEEKGGNGGMGGDSFTFCGSMPMAWQYRNEVIES